MEIIDLFEFDKYEELKDVDIRKLKEFLRETWNKRNIFSSYEEEEFDSDLEDLSELKKQPFLIFNNQKIKARNYIGFIQFENTRINIYPKIFKEIDLNNKKIFFDNILFWLSYCSKIDFPFNEFNPNNQEFDDFLEIFIYLFSNYTEKILSEKPYSCYEEITEETTFLKGHLSIPEYIKENLITGNWQNFYCTYEPFIYNNTFNKIVKYVSKILLNNTKNKNNIKKLENILFILDEVDNVTCNYQDCLKIKFNRLYEDLDLILNMCKMFLSNELINSDFDNNKNFCFLLPMEKIFEDFIYGFINKHFPEQKAQYQKSSQFLTDEKVFQLKPDIFLKKSNTIIDTKYKIRNLTEDIKKAGVLQSDMYQMVSYSLKYDSNNVIILYPSEHNSDNNSNQKKHFSISSPFFTDNRKINIHISNIKITHSSSVSEINESLKKELSEILGTIKDWE